MRKLRLLLFPFAGIYYLVTLTRNKLYDASILKSKKYSLPIICVGNLSTGGTGKSPMTEYIIRLLKENHNLATLSRGYGRKTTGYREVTPQSLATEVGDEPLQFAKKFEKIQVAVCEDRQTGIETLLEKINPPNVILLDDAFQHRKVQAGFNIVLTSHGDVYSKDFLLPAGNLREPRSGAQRADIVVVTKCPNNVSAQEQQDIKQSLKLKPQQSLFFSKIAYDNDVYSGRGVSSFNSLKVKKVTLVTGIANPTPLVTHLQKNGLTFTQKTYGDHHNFTPLEIAQLEKLDCIITTEKDYVRLRPLLNMKDLFYLPIQVAFLDQAVVFDEKIKQFVTDF